LLRIASFDIISRSGGGSTDINHSILLDVLNWGASGAFFRAQDMLNTILASKQKMSQTFIGDTRVLVTFVKAGPCIVTHIKKIHKDGYWAIQLGFGEKKIKNVTKPLKGHLKGAIKDKKAPRFLREVHLDNQPDLKVGDQIKVSDIFKKGDVVSVTGTSKGKGFAGVIKRWGFSMGPRTHGQSDRLRAPGSIGATTPGRVWKGKKMAGRMGGKVTTVKNLIVVDVNDEKGELALSGTVPGVYGGLLIITKLASGKLTKLIQEAPEVKKQVEKEPESEGESKDKEGN
jgi:large subunit ribosomal protein L3